MFSLATLASAFLLVAPNLFDRRTTTRQLNAGAVEQNPLFARAMRRLSANLLWLPKLAVLAIAAGFWARGLLLGAAGARLACAGYGFVVWSNWHVVAELE